MSRLSLTFTELKQQGRKALIPFITAGDPHPRITVPLMHALVKAGADVLELGVPFSDPMADGPTIQLACERALAHNTNLRQIIGMVAEFRQVDQKTPIVLMGYLNPIERMGVRPFAEAAAVAGVDGVLIVDLAVEEAPGYLPALRAQGLDCIFLLAPTSPLDRIAAIAREGSGYLYYVSLKGVTGAASLDVKSVEARLADIRTQTPLPVAVGFGIRDAASAQAVGRVADGVVVGSALVARVAALRDDEARLLREVPAVLAELRAALDSL